ncbi:glycosyltransferase [Zobellia barbeyronii]|uniref:Glycosyltransferase n=1 Tax=Zobellia barbeyronii TaxID=2748009 RepID=A0ABS5WM15_9FLAO|nr:glycosyltransferase [Zobellia barbeyronii]MBT2163207.1 glycosyltransferase [Zobellia barbeyronii]
MSLYLAKHEQICRVIILSKKTSKGWDELEENFDIVYLPFSSYFIGALALIPYLLFKNYSDVSYTFSSQTIINGTLGLAKRLKVIKAKVILRESNSIFKLLSGYKLKIYSLFYSIGYKGSSLVITQTDYMKNQLIEALPTLTKKLNITTISNPFNFDDISSRTGTIAKEYENKKFIVAAGRLAPAKGFDILIDAFKIIALKHPNLNLIILGEGSERASLSNKIESLGLKDKIHMPGYVKNVYAYFKKAEACVLSSRIEGFPNVLLQMMSQNTAIAATLSAGGIEDIPNIYTCPTENIEKLKDCIINAIENDTEANKLIFESFLKSRTQASFYNTMMESLD